MGKSFWKCSVGIGALVLSAAGLADVQHVSLWRGERMTVLLNDPVALGTPPPGITLREGTACEVRYRTQPMGRRYATMADRVAWDVPAVGLRVLSVAAAADLKAGTYAVGELRIHVVDRVLPPPCDWKYHLDLWQHPWAVARYHGLVPFSPEHYAAMKPLWEMLADAGGKALTVTLLDSPWNHQCFDVYHSMIGRVRRADGSWRFDYRLFDDYVTFGRGCGLGPDIACYTMCPWGYEVSWLDEEGTPHKERAVPGSEAFRDYWGDFLVDFAAHLKAKGWFGDTYVCLDERSPEDVRNIVRFVNEKAPGLKVFLAGNRPPSAFEGIRLDACCFGLGEISDQLLSEAAARRAQGMRTTYYVCCSPNCPNTMCHNELEEAFWLGAYPALAGLDGFLRWAWNSWPADPVRDASFAGPGGGWRAGDTYLVYPLAQPSLRFLELRNGIVAAEKLRLLREQGRFTAEIDALVKRYDRSAALANRSNFSALKRETQNLVNRP